MEGLNPEEVHNQFLQRTGLARGSVNVRSFYRASNKRWYVEVNDEPGGIRLLTSDETSHKALTKMVRIIRACNTGSRDYA